MHPTDLMDVIDPAGFLRTRTPADLGQVAAELEHTKELLLKALEELRRIKEGQPNLEIVLRASLATAVLERAIKARAA